jgi:hypothetical protein
MTIDTTEKHPEPIENPDDSNLTLEDLLEMVGGAPPVEQVVQPAKSDDDEDFDLLSEQDVEMYKALLEMHGPDPQIESILAEDRRKHGDIKRWQRAQRLNRAAVVPVANIPFGAPWGRTKSDQEPSSPSTPPSISTETGSGPRVTVTSSTSEPPPPIALPDEASLAAALVTVRDRDSRTLRAQLAKIMGALHVHATVKKHHAEVRKWIWAINTVMTERDEVAPCVRAQPKLGVFFRRPADMSEEQKLMLNDRQIFDLQFLHKHRWGKPVKKWHALLRSDPFDPVLAAHFVKTVGTIENKVKALGLREEEQMQLAALRAEKIRKRWERLDKEVDRLGDELRGVAGMAPSKVPPEHVELWAEEYIALVIAKGSPAAASRLLPRLFARTRPANQLANRKGDLASKGFEVG